MRPPSPGSTRAVVCRTIHGVLDEATERGMDICRPTDEDRAFIKARLKEVAPYKGQTSAFRGSWYYKVWLKERRQIFLMLQIPVRQSAGDEVPGVRQITIFEALQELQNNSGGLPPDN